MSSLFGLAERLKEIEEEIEYLEETGAPDLEERTKALYREFLDVRDGFENKLDDTLNLIRYLQSAMRFQTEEARRHEKKLCAIDRRIEWVKLVTREVLKSKGFKKLETMKNTAWTQFASKAPLRIREEAVPPEYKKTIEIVDKEKIVDDLNAGIILPFAEYGDKTEFLQFR